MQTWPSQEQYLDRVQDRFRKDFPNSHLIISYEMSVHRSGNTHTWTLWIVFDECEELNPCKIFEQFETFKELDHRLNWHTYRHRLIRDNYLAGVA